MPFTPTNGTVTTAGTTETNLFDITGNAYYSCWVFLHNLTATETYTIRVYVLDGQSSVMRKFLEEPRVGVQADPAVFIPPVPAAQYRVTVQRAGGSDRAITFQRWEQT